jgi:NAD(P)-dependent dehydrogenase (short-subunit alcohol dehydrogenase family)
MAVELAGDGILVNSVCPGWIETPMLDRVLDGAMLVLGAASHEEVWRAFQQFLLIKRTGRAEEVAALVVYLASGRASYITGSVYDVDGGFVKSV